VFNPDSDNSKDCATPPPPGLVGLLGVDVPGEPTEMPPLLLLLDESVADILPVSELPPLHAARSAVQKAAIAGVRKSLISRFHAPFHQRRMRLLGLRILARRRVAFGALCGVPSDAFLN